MFEGELKDLGWLIYRRDDGTGDLKNNLIIFRRLLKKEKEPELATQSGSKLLSGVEQLGRELGKYS